MPGIGGAEADVGEGEAGEEGEEEGVSPSLDSSSEHWGGER
jgi:hypothetical protein